MLEIGCFLLEETINVPTCILTTLLLGPLITQILVINCRRAEKESFCTDLSLQLKKKLLCNHSLKSWPKSEDEDISALCDESFVS